MTTAGERVVLPSGKEKAIWMRNFLILCRVVGEETGGAIALLEFTVAPNDGPPLHTHHNEDETFFVLDGNFLIQVGERLADVSAGGCVFGPRDVTHGFLNAGAVPAKLLVVATPAGCEGYFEELGRPADAKVLPSPAVAVDMELAATIGRKYNCDIVGPPSKH